MAPRTRVSNRVLIVDSGMRNLGGHNFSYTRSVESALKERGFEVVVLAHKQLAPEISQSTGYQPTFSCGAYDYPPGNGKWRDLRYLYAQSVVFADELEAAFRRFGDATPELIFCHTVNDFELIGWNRFLRRHKLPAHLMILLRQTPGFAGCSKIKQLVHPYWRIKPHSLRGIHNRLGSRFVLLTDSEPLSRDYAAIFPDKIVTMPIPIPDLILADAPDRHQGGMKELNIGYLGDARSAKGFPLLPGLVERVLSNPAVSARFVIQCPASASGSANAGLPEGVSELYRLADRWNGRVQLIDEKLGEMEYAELFRSIDVVLVPYERKGYVEPTSGIFAEALALARPVVVPTGTWMAGELKKSGGGVEFRSGDVADLTESVLKVLQRYDEYAARAAEFAGRWREFHNAKNLARMLLSTAGIGNEESSSMRFGERAIAASHVSEGLL